MNPSHDLKLNGPKAASGQAAYPDARASTLVLYDTTGPWGFLGEIYAQQGANLVSHFGSWTAKPVASYQAGDMAAFTAVLYLGSTYDEPLPKAFLAEVKAATRPVLWAGSNVWQLAKGGPDSSPGWTMKGFDQSALDGVTYKGTRFERSGLLSGGIPNIVVTSPATQVLATASRSDGSTLPWAIRSGKFFYVAEVPFSYVGPDDRYLVFADLLFELLEPSRAPRHRALVRIEDVGPASNPDQLRALADALAARKVPFSVAVYPAYRDPLGAYNHGLPNSRDLDSAPDQLSALVYLQDQGGTLIMHGYTHQFGEELNPYSGTSADDFEFYRAHIDPRTNVIMDGPVPEDSQAWASRRLKGGLAAFTAAGLDPPAIFEPPHYAASVDDYRSIQAMFSARYDRGLYFPGFLKDARPDYRKPVNQFFPYLVRDVYGSLVIPENLGNVIGTAYNQNSPRSPSAIVRSASKNLVIRDGFASFFYHPTLGTAGLVEIVDAMIAQGWTFVSVAEASR